MMSTPTNAQDAARNELLKQIADNAKRTEDFTNQVNRSETLKNLAEAYAYVSAPNNAH